MTAENLHHISTNITTNITENAQRLLDKIKRGESQLRIKKGLNGCQGEMNDLIPLYFDKAIINIVTVIEVKEIVQNLFQHVNHRYQYDDLVCLYITEDTLLALDIPKYIEDLLNHMS